MLPSRIAEELKLAFAPVAVIFTEEKPDGALQFAEGRWGCVIAMLTAAAKGRTAAIDRKTCGCPGGRVGLGFGGFDPERGIEYFLSTGRGEGFPEGEGYRKTPELAKTFVEDLPVADIPFTYIVFKPLSEVDPAKDTVREVVFYVNPDQLTALIVLVNYGQAAGREHVIIPASAGCQSIGVIPYREALSEHPRAVVGMTDVSARPFVPPDILTFTVPFALYQEMENNVPGSFLEKPAWAKVKARIGEK